MAPRFARPILLLPPLASAFQPFEWSEWGAKLTTESDSGNMRARLSHSDAAAVTVELVSLVELDDTLTPVTAAAHVVHRPIADWTLSDRGAAKCNVGSTVTMCATYKAKIASLPEAKVSLSLFLGQSQMEQRVNVYEGGSDEKSAALGEEATRVEAGGIGVNALAVAVLRSGV